MLRRLRAERLTPGLRLLPSGRVRGACVAGSRRRPWSVAGQSWPPWPRSSPRAARRLVTVTGPPGVGKTRLALAAARPGGRPVPRRRGLGRPRAGPRRASSCSARSRGPWGSCRTAGDESALSRLGAAVAGRDVLVVLDNCEHLLGGRCPISARCSPRARGCASWPPAASGCSSRPSASSRRRRCRCRRPTRSTTSTGCGPIRRSRCCSRAPRPTSTLTGRTARSLADVCVRLDGLPLAIELAAARLRVFTPGELAFRLEQRMALLTGGSRDAPSRHRDLRSAITWSHDLLPDAERTVFRRLSVFVGDWTLDAADAVCGDGAAGVRRRRRVVARQEPDPPRGRDRPRRRRCPFHDARQPARVRGRTARAARRDGRDPRAARGVLRRRLAPVGRCGRHRRRGGDLAAHRLPARRSALGAGLQPGRSGRRPDSVAGHRSRLVRLHPRVARRRRRPDRARLRDRLATGGRPPTPWPPR